MKEEGAYYNRGYFTFIPHCMHIVLASDVSWGSEMRKPWPRFTSNFFLLICCFRL